MATLHPETDSLVLHVVYDGAPRSGKTASVRALGHHLRGEVVTPEEHDGRTLYFDWLEYRGGRKLGRPVHCRIIAVPGQAQLRGRRAAILAAADVVVFVVDSTPEGIAAAERHLVALRQVLDARPRNVPIFLQINKRDLPEALEVLEILERLGCPTEGGVRLHQETVAPDGVGVRETFVFAVGWAIRRLEENGGLYRSAESERTTQEIFLPSPDRLLEMIAELEQGGVPEIDWDAPAAAPMKAPT